jgi:hypothetical protein
LRLEVKKKFLTFNLKGAFAPALSTFNSKSGGFCMSKDKLKISVAEAHVLRESIIKMKLETPEWFELLSYDELAECYNGAGSDNTPRDVRKILTRLLGFAEEAVLIHDAEYEYTSRFEPLDYMERKKFHTANKRLGDNAYLLAKKRTPWYLPLRYYWRLFVSMRAKSICDYWGYDAWV